MSNTTQNNYKESILAKEIAENLGFWVSPEDETWGFVLRVNGNSEHVRHSLDLSEILIWLEGVAWERARVASLMKAMKEEIEP